MHMNSTPTVTGRDKYKGRSPTFKKLVLAYNSGYKKTRLDVEIPRFLSIVDVKLKLIAYLRIKGHIYPPSVFNVFG